MFRANTNFEPNGSQAPFLTLLPHLNLEIERSLLDQIDPLRWSGVDEFVHLPHVVAVGAQPAGKSSALEAISGLDFPRSGSKCTRFAIEIRLRRSKKEKRSISIIPAKDGSEKHSSNCKIQHNGRHQL